jgi:stearoyl-CoA desaturase (delta-9 desaturase)
MNQVEQAFDVGDGGGAGNEEPGAGAEAEARPDAPAKSAGAKETMIQKMRRTSLTPPTVGLMVIVHALAIAAFTQPFKLSYVPIMIGIYTWCMLGNTLYLHRGIAHRAFEMTLPVKLFFTPSLFIGLLGEPVGWAAIHRHHHRTSDTPDDLHSPRHGFWFAHAVWFHRLPREEAEKILTYAKDVRKDPIFRVAHNPAVFLLGHIAAAGAMYALLGFSGLLWCLYLPIVLVNHVESMINSVCHSPRFGYRSFETRDDSRNVAWLGLLSMGDSFHNNHHHAGKRARHGLAWYEIDVTRGVIYVLEKLRLVRNVSW